MGAVASASIPNLQTPLSSAAVLADQTNGNVALFTRFMNDKVGPPESLKPFVSASLWLARSASTRPLVVVGAQPELLWEPSARIASLVDHAATSHALALNDLLTAKDRRLGYALTSADENARYVVYAETALPEDRRADIAANSAFSDLGYALYLGATPDGSQLLASSTGGALLEGRRASVTVPFGDTQILVVLTPHKELGGTLMARLPLALAILGLLITAGAVMLVETITRRRAQAERLAEENGRLYAGQRSVAQTLQHSMLPDVFPDVEGLEIAARYEAGVEEIDIGGDWYDVVTVDDSRVLVVAGDVSGRGLQAATMMASMRFSIRAYAAEHHSPGEILNALSKLVNLARDGHFATVLCALVDVPGRSITYANAGHPQPLLVDGQNAEFDRDCDRCADRCAAECPLRRGRHRGAPASDVLPLHRRARRAARRESRRRPATPRERGGGESRRPRRRLGHDGRPDDPRRLRRRRRAHRSEMADLGDAGSRATVDASVDAPGTRVITIAGELDMSNVYSIEAEFASIVASNPKVSSDFSALTFMDSSGIAMLLRAADRADGVALRPSPVVKRVIAATGLTDVFELVDD